MAGLLPRSLDLLRKSSWLLDETLKNMDVPSEFSLFRSKSIPDLGFDVTLENKDGLPLMHSVTMTLNTPLFKTQIDQIAVLRDLNDKVDSTSILGVVDFKSGRPVIIRGVHEICGGYDEADIYSHKQFKSYTPSAKLSSNLFLAIITV
ncbi:hypothetical protein [uncultured Acinetobacter sp.]|jgi:hypothetical protein|uniref:hypothetical protein n=1 Tax=uncultured Acinetobacter sp. TaxID=165433 RepID=UPI002629CFBD|nr:hypothetical protein [uncultured Acinetobacter sp.]